MGRRKISAPRRGSLAYLPRGRAASWIPRIRYWPDIDGKPNLLGFPGYKAGMTLASYVDNRQGSLTFGKEVVSSTSVVETPSVFVAAIRAYTANPDLKAFREAWVENPPKDLARLITLPEKFETSAALSRMENGVDKISELRAVVLTQPRQTGVGRKTPQVMEIKVGGGDSKSQFEFSRSILGKQVAASTVFKEGDFVDVLGVTKGKGIQGPVKRWGVRKLSHKSRKTVRGVGSIGPWHPHFVMYSVPRAGQTGFHQRTERNKLVLRLGTDGGQINPAGGFLRYGEVRNPYVLLKGSIPGPARRLVALRVCARRRATAAPKLEYVSLESKQGVHS